MRPKTILLATLMASTVLGAVFSSAYAFDLLDPPRKWFQGVGGGPDDLPVTFLINENGEESVADGDNGVTACIEATQWWEDELENGLNLLTLGTTPVNAVGRDGLNVVSFNDPARIVRRALAVSVVGWYDAGQTETVNGIEFGRYQESDVSFSKRYDYTTSAIGNCDGQFDIQAIQAQEIGHSLGLGHSNVSAAVMFGSIGSCVFKTIQPDDHDAINTVYNPGFGGITPCTPTEALLTEHSYSSPRRGRNCLVITVGVSNDCDNAVSGASVTVRLVGAEAGDTLSGTANTNGSGTVSFGLRCRDAASTTYVSTVMGIGGALSWNPGDPGNTADNPITCVITR